MLYITIPGWETLEIKNVVFDLNGTLAIDGKIDEDIKDKVNRLADSLNLYVITADTHGNLHTVLKGMRIEGVFTKTVDAATEKESFISKLGSYQTIAIGNGSNDRKMLKVAAIGIAVIGPEGASPQAIINADMVVRSISDAVECLKNPTRIIATLRG